MEHEFRTDPIGWLEQQGVTASIPMRDSVGALFKSGRPLRIKLGIDPTAPHLHLGHAVILRVLKKFQDLGHAIVLIIGDFTGRIGDPSGRSETRTILTEKEVRANEKKYLVQAGKFLNLKKTEVRHNSEWLKKGGVPLFFELMSLTTVQQVLERQDFRERMGKNQEVALLETLYPALQGFDSVAVEADVEVGGSDQEFNLLMGRRIQTKYRALGRYKKDPQHVLTLRLLVGTDGVRKMSKSFGNAINLEDAPDDMFGKVMSIGDETMWRDYFSLLTDIPTEESRRLGKQNPRDAKLRLAREIVSMCHGAGKAKKAEEHFLSLFSKKETGDIPVKKISADEILPLLVTLGFASSASDARRLINQGAVEFEGNKISDVHFKMDRPGTLRAGKKNFVRIVIK